MPEELPKRVEEALVKWRHALAQPSRKRKLSALRDLVLRQAEELAKQDKEILELEETYEDMTARGDGPNG